MRRMLGCLHKEIVACTHCPRRGFGDPRARLVIVGLAPAVHGGNRPQGFTRNFFYRLP